MAPRRIRVKKTVAASDISIEGSRALEPKLAPETSDTVVTRSHKPIKTYLLIALFFVILLLIASLPAIYFYQKYQSTTSTTALAEAQVKSLIAEVGTVILLPTAEVPTVATVSDKSKLTGQSFFAYSENGDKVLIYTKAKKAILYRPAKHLIIEVGPVNIQADATDAAPKVAGASTSATTTPAPITVELLNGTTVPGLTKVVEQTLKDASPTVTVTGKDNAVKSDYTETLVISLTPAGKAVAAQLAATLIGKVSALPKGEIAPLNTDMLIILGQNATQ